LKIAASPVLAVIFIGVIYFRFSVSISLRVYSESDSSAMVNVQRVQSIDYSGKMHYIPPVSMVIRMVIKMNKLNEIEGDNISRRNFLKKLATGAVFTIPTIQSFSLLASQDDRGKDWWTGHGHGNHHGRNNSSTPLPPPPSGF